MKTITEAPLIVAARKVFTALTRWMSPTPMNVSVVIMRMPIPAPK